MQLPSTEAQIVSKGAYYQHDQYDHPIFNDELEENFLYHYTTLSSLVAIGNSGTLRASPFKNCNDPTERYQNNRTSIDGNFPNDSEARKDWFQEKNRGNSILDNIRRNAHVLCFSVDRLEKCGITRKGFAIPQMWAHYGDSRKGVCLIFARDQILTETKKMGQKYEARAIVYDTSQASGSTIKLNPIEIKRNFQMTNFARNVSHDLLIYFGFTKMMAGSTNKSIDLFFPNQPIHSHIFRYKVQSRGYAWGPTSPYRACNM